MARKREVKTCNKEQSRSPKSSKFKSSEKPVRKSDYNSLTQQLSTINLMLKEIPGDGNCLFGALGDQFDGTSITHLKHRQDVVSYMRIHRKDFEPFVEDDEPFHRHLSKLSEAGTYGGNECIVAFSRLHGVKIVIHQLNSPLWHVDDSEGNEDVQELHVSYHNGEHYNSVRRMGDFSNDPPHLKLNMCSLTHNLPCMPL